VDIGNQLQRYSIKVALKVKNLIFETIMDCPGTFMQWLESLAATASRQGNNR
jgi:hypothetical protein